MPTTEASGKRLLHEINARNVLSFGPDGMSLELRPLNVLIGPNGSGKSNLLELVALLRAAPSSLAGPVRDGGGVKEWIWKGEPRSTATLSVVVVDVPLVAQPLRHTIDFNAFVEQFMLVGERIEEARTLPVLGSPEPFYRFQSGQRAVRVRDGEVRHLPPQLPFGSTAESILSQLKDPIEYREITFLGVAYDSIRLYREWAFGRSTVFRQPQRADLRNDRLEEDFSNLALFLNKLRRQPRTKAALLEHLRDLYEGLTDVDVSVEGNTVQVFFTEGEFTIPATRLSDGSLRYLCLLAILLDPDPPPLIGIEEPELGLHPDLMPGLARLLVSASERTQLVVTTHSDILVDALTEQPESVVVCEKHNGETTMQRLDPDELSVWLEKYRLGELWTSGQLGGTRW